MHLGNSPDFKPYYNPFKVPVQQALSRSRSALLIDLVCIFPWIKLAISFVHKIFHVTPKAYKLVKNEVKRRAESYENQNSENKEGVDKEDDTLDLILKNIINDNSNLK